MRPLQESPFSKHINRLVWYGGWLPDTESRLQKYFFYVYKFGLNTLCLYASYLLFKDFCMVFGDMKKMVWNLCVTILFLGTFTKSLQMVAQKEKINDLRVKLHQSAESKNGPEYAPIHNLALKQLWMLRVMLYGSAAVFVPIWLLTRYLDHMRELPIPLHLPFETDLQDEGEYALAFILAGLGGICGLFFGIETEMAMFCFFIQLEREYRFLIKDVEKLNVLYSKMDFTDYAEVNPCLRKMKAQMMLRDLFSRQKELIEIHARVEPCNESQQFSRTEKQPKNRSVSERCVKTFENCYSQTFLQQFFGVSALITLLGLQCTLETVDLFGSIMYQMGYLSAVIINLFLLCWFSTRLKFLCCEVGEAAYSTHWYQMDSETIKGLAMIILRSQHPPKLTTGGLMELNLAAFLNRMSNIFSWLVLLRELQVTKDPS